MDPAFKQENDLIIKMSKTDDQPVAKQSSLGKFEILSGSKKNQVPENNSTSKNYCNRELVTKVLKIGFIWSGFFVSLATVATAVTTYNSNNCDCESTNSTSGSPSNSAEIANIVVAAAASFCTFVREYYAHTEAEREKKEAFIERTTREQLENEKHKELLQGNEALLKQLGVITDSYVKYNENRNSQNFNECLENIKNLPEDTNSSAVIELRDGWLSKAVSIRSDTKNKLQKALQDLDTLGKEIESIDKKIKEMDANQGSKHGNEGENHAKVGSDNTTNQLAINLTEYQKKWKEVEDQCGFCPQSLWINNTRYDKNGNVLERKEK